MKLYALYVKDQNNHYQYIVSSDQEESVEDFVDLYLSVIPDILYDEYSQDQTVLDQLMNKLVNREYEVELYSDGEREEVSVVVRETE